MGCQRPLTRERLYITSKRVIFRGARQTRECAFAKLIGFQHSDTEGSTTFSVSNRQKATTMHYGQALSGAFDFRLDLALAHFRGTVGDLVGRARNLQGRHTKLTLRDRHGLERGTHSRRYLRASLPGWQPL